MHLFRWFRKYSFSIYLYHLYFLFLGNSYAGTPFASMGYSIFMSIAMGVLMYNIVEYPCSILRTKVVNFIKIKTPGFVM